MNGYIRINRDQSRRPLKKSEAGGQPHVDVEIRLGKPVRTKTDEFLAKFRSKKPQRCQNGQLPLIIGHRIESFLLIAKSCGKDVPFVLANSKKCAISYGETFDSMCPNFN